MAGLASGEIGCANDKATHLIAADADSPSPSPQPLVRTPLLDRYFVYTSLFGTHSFFLIFLPAAFWFGNPYFARGLVNVLAFGVYFSSAIKDLLCVPRPYSPPVTRLTVGSTHLEYGFPSTHSTNSVGTALYIWLWIHALRQQAVEGAASSIPGLQSWWWDIGLLVYAFSVVHGRVYAGMHSVMDCTAGSLLGAAITLAQWYGFDVIESWLATPGWTVPIVLISACLLLVSVHPEPLDDCPCFEDGECARDTAMASSNPLTTASLFSQPLHSSPSSMECPWHAGPCCDFQTPTTLETSTPWHHRRHRCSTILTSLQRRGRTTSFPTRRKL